MDYQAGRVKYESSDWLCLSGERRVALGLDYEMADNPNIYQLSDIAKSISTGRPWRPIRVIWTDRVKDFPRCKFAAEAVGVPEETFRRWLKLKNCPPAGRVTDKFLCARYI